MPGNYLFFKQLDILRTITWIIHGSPIFPILANLVMEIFKQQVLTTQSHHLDFGYAT